MGSLAAFMASFDLELENAGYIKAVIFSGFALIGGPAAASPFGSKVLFHLTRVSN